MAESHARVEITANTYAHVLPDMQAQAAAAIGALLFPTRDPTSVITA